MSPCEQKEAIDDIWESIDGLKDSTIRMAKDVSRLVDEFTIFSKTLRENMLDEREHRTRLEQNTQDINRLYSIVREEQKLRQEELLEQKEDLGKKLEPLIAFKNQIEGSIATSKAIPIMASAVAIFASLIALLK